MSNDVMTETSWIWAHTVFQDPLNYCNHNLVEPATNSDVGYALFNLTVYLFFRRMMYHWML